jgi:predicted AAA+ superfamily ATPase
VYTRDSGLVHALLGLPDKEAVLGHPVAGPGWEGMAIENLLAAAGADGHHAQGSFYRTSHGAEIDLVLAWPDGEEWAIEIKRSLAPTLERGFHSALADLEPQRALIAYPGSDHYRLAPPIEAIPLAELCAQAQTRSQAG